jgi:AcrR family transcriptional regulator
LFEAVNDLLTGENTYADISINAMVAEAGIAKSTFYQYFTGKNDLLSSFTEQIIEATGGDHNWLAFTGPRTRDSLERSIRDRLDAYQPYLPLMSAAFEAAYVDAGVRETVEKLMDLLDRGLADHIRTGQERGWIDAALPPEETAKWLNWMVSRGVHRLVMKADAARTDALVAGISQMVWSALYEPKA